MSAALDRLARFDAVFVIDFEFFATDGEHPVPVCLVAHELRSGQRMRFEQDELQRMREPPYDVGPRAVVLAYYASAEVGCHLALGWAPPTNLIDLYVEFRNMTTREARPAGAGLVGAAAHFGVDSLGAAEKNEMRGLVLRGGPHAEAEARAIVDYCEQDVVVATAIADKLLPQVDVERALLRGRYVAAVAAMERTGVPVDVGHFRLLAGSWDRLRLSLIERVHEARAVYEGITFVQKRFEAWLLARGLDWPRLDSGHAALDDDTFRRMSRRDPGVARLREVRRAVSQLRVRDLAVGSDGRNRCLLSPFGSITGRNTPSSTKFIFGAPSWLRGLIRPQEGMGLAYVDFEQQEFGIAAALSGDEAMQRVYLTADPYISFAVETGRAPRNATRHSHPRIREQFKACILGTQYGMEAESLARDLGISTAHARELLRLHKDTFPAYWRWSAAAVDHAKLLGYLSTVYGWTLRTSASTNPRTLRNFPMQANGAEMLRLACILAIGGGIRVCAPVHDALLIEAPAGELDEAVRATQAAMARASRIVLDGFELRTEAKLYRFPERFMDGRGVEMWATVSDLLAAGQTR